MRLGIRFAGLLETLGFCIAMVFFIPFMVYRVRVSSGVVFLGLDMRGLETGDKIKQSLTYL